MRDHAREDAFYEELRETVERISGHDAGPIIELARHRMGSLGAEQYGDAAFLEDDRDLVRELREEMADAVAYALMETEKMYHHERDEPQAIHNIFQAAVHAAIADAYARAAQSARRLGEG